MSKEPELKARDKVVVRMTREGAVEENLTAGTEQRVSKRPEDAELVNPGETVEPSEALSAEEQKKVQMRRQQRLHPSRLSEISSDGRLDRLVVKSSLRWIEAAPVCRPKPRPPWPGEPYRKDELLDARQWKVSDYRTEEHDTADQVRTLSRRPIELTRPRKSCQ